jgi:hypothetical protein
LSTDIGKYTDPVEGVEVLRKTFNYPLLAALSALTSLIPAVSTFLYGRRMLQMRFNIFNSILLVALQGFIVYYIIADGEKTTFAIQSVFPAISLVLSILAIRNILRDELLIKSLNRIR